MSNYQKSHEAHSTWYQKKHSSQDEQELILRQFQENKDKPTIHRWLRQRFFGLLTPFLTEAHSWLTVGDPYGFDAHYLSSAGHQARASDIAGTFLSMSKEMGIITEYAVENAERLSFADNSFDFVLCKEAYHHFPRPYLAVYEMVRVCRKAVVLIEPQDPVSKMPLLLAFCNLLDRLDPHYTRKIWKNRYSYEEVGNYVFKLSEREMNKLACGMGLPAVAFKGIHNNFYKSSIAEELTDPPSGPFRKLQLKAGMRNLLSKLSLLPHDVLCAVIFKVPPDEAMCKELRKQGFVLHHIPPNPYI